MVPALRWLAERFEEQRKIRVTFDLPEDLGRFPASVELTLFRIAQECLTNVAKHSGSAAADIRLASDGHTVRLEVADQGRGIAATNGMSKQSAPPQSGVGTHAMRERVRQLEGEFEIRSASAGTIVSVVLPIA